MNEFTGTREPQLFLAEIKVTPISDEIEPYSMWRLVMAVDIKEAHNKVQSVFPFCDVEVYLTL